MRPRLLSFELAWTDAALDAFFPEGTALPHGIRDVAPARSFDDLLAETPLEQSLGMRIALWIVALAPLFTIRRLGTIASIGEDDRRRVLERLVASPVYAVRQLVIGLKAMASLLYLRSPAVRASMITPVRGASGELVALRLGKRSEGASRRDHAAE